MTFPAGIKSQFWYIQKLLWPMEFIMEIKWKRIRYILYFTLFIVYMYVLIINVVSCLLGALIWKIKYLVYYAW